MGPVLNPVRYVDSGAREKGIGRTRAVVSGLPFLLGYRWSSRLFEISVYPRPPPADRSGESSLFWSVISWLSPLFTRLGTYFPNALHTPDLVCPRRGLSHTFSTVPGVSRCRLLSVPALPPARRLAPISLAGHAYSDAMLLELVGCRACLILTLYPVGPGLSCLPDVYDSPLPSFPCHLSLRGNHCLIAQAPA